MSCCLHQRKSTDWARCKWKGGVHRFVRVVDKWRRIHIHTYTYIYIHIHTYTYIYIHIHTYIYIHIHIHTHIRTYAHTNIRPFLLVFCSVASKNYRELTIITGFCNSYVDSMLQAHALQLYPSAFWRDRITDWPC